MKQISCTATLMLSLAANCAVAGTPIAPKEWVSQLLALEARTSKLSELTDDGRFRLKMDVARLLGALSDCSPEPKSEAASVYCANAAQSLSNFISDATRGGERGAASAQREMTTFRQNKPKCVKLAR